MTRLAIIGAGGMGSVHALAAAGLPGVAVTWVADQDPVRAQTLAVQVGARATASTEAAVAASDVDAVVIALPTPVHRVATELAARHGKHVFCEKPIARELADAEAMVAACDAAGVRLMIGHVVRFFPEYAGIKQILDDGTLGRIALARASRVTASPPARAAWFGDLASSGGLVIDLMIHDLDTLGWYFGDVERIYAHGLSYTPYQLTNDYALAVLRFTNGVIAHVEASWAHSGFRTTIEIAGEHGVVRHDSDQSAPLRLEQTGPATPQPPGPPVSRAVPLPASPHQVELRHFVDGLASGEPFLTDGEEAIRALRLAHAVLDAVRTGRVQEVAS